MKKRPYILFFGTILGLILTLLVLNVSFAENGNNNNGNGLISCPSQCAEQEGVFCLPNPLCAEDLSELIWAIATFVFNIALILAPLMLIVAGFYFVTSMGEPDKVRKAKDLALYTIIGLVIVLLARGLVTLIAQILTSNNNT